MMKCTSRAHPADWTCGRQDHEQGEAPKLSSRRLREALSGAVLVGFLGEDAALHEGADASGLGLETILVPDNRNPGDFACIHAMPRERRRS